MRSPMAFSMASAIPTFPNNRGPCESARCGLYPARIPAAMSCFVKFQLVDEPVHRAVVPLPVRFLQVSDIPRDYPVIRTVIGPLRSCRCAVWGSRILAVISPLSSSSLALVLMAIAPFAARGIMG